MNELLPGIFHWRVAHPDILIEVDSYYVACLTPAFLIDPLLPQEGLAWFGDRLAPQHIYLTNRLHDRHCRRLRKAFDLKVWCHEAGAARICQRQPPGHGVSVRRRIARWGPGARGGRIVP